MQLGNTGFSWSDVLLGDLPNVYVYACNNPSESIIAKRRGYGTSERPPADGGAGAAGGGGPCPCLLSPLQLLPWLRHRCRCLQPEVEVPALLYLRLPLPLPLPILLTPPVISLLLPLAVVSYNVPPYGRAGLYKQLAELKDLIAGWCTVCCGRSGAVVTPAGGAATSCWLFCGPRLGILTTTLSHLACPTTPQSTATSLWVAAPPSRGPSLSCWRLQACRWVGGSGKNRGCCVGRRRL